MVQASTLLPLITLLTCYIFSPSFLCHTQHPHGGATKRPTQTHAPLIWATYPMPSLLKRAKSNGCQSKWPWTMQYVVQARSHAIRLRLIHHDDGEQGAWSDCLELYEATVHQFNHTLELNPLHLSSQSDKRSWLSAALTNLGTCSTSLAEVSVSGSAMEPLLTNVSELISNSLAITTCLARRDANEPGLGQVSSGFLVRSGYSKGFSV